MITEDYVSFETAKLLKEKGFDVSKIDAYFPFVYYSNGKMYFYNDDEPLFVCEAVTIQMAMKWLREVHNLFLQIWILTDEGYWFNIERLEDGHFNHKSVYSTGLQDIYFPTYEEACEAAIKYCLENLI